MTSLPGPAPAADLAVNARSAVVESDGAWQLAGSVCGACGAVTFPSRTMCHHCLSSDVQTGPVGSTGELYSWSTVHVSSSRPVPYTLGYVDLPRGLRVLALIAADPARLRIGQQVRLAVGDGGWAFVPGRAGTDGESER
jgi:uncharacterized OB-fold protein